jgi:hypothetical protein
MLTAQHPEHSEIQIAPWAASLFNSKLLHDTVSDSQHCGMLLQLTAAAGSAARSYNSMPYCGRKLLLTISEINRADSILTAGRTPTGAVPCY